MDWGFGDAVLALRPMREILISAIRQMMMKSLESSGINLASTKLDDNGGLRFSSSPTAWEVIWLWTLSNQEHSEPTRQKRHSKPERLHPLIY
jgi:hypothetical protein